MKKRRTRMLAWVCVLLIICLAFGSLLPHAHVCAGGSCRICASFERLRHILSLALTGAVSALLAAILINSGREARRFSRPERQTPVLLRVKLSI